MDEYGFLNAATLPGREKTICLHHPCLQKNTAIFSITIMEGRKQFVGYVAETYLVVPQVISIENKVTSKETSHQNLDAAAMAEVVLLKEGTHAPGKIYSLMKSELLLYSLYLSSGIDENCTQITEP
eukprot:Gb_06584 [translate_table: standard]